MSCGKTTSRRQAQTARRSAVIKNHTAKVSKKATQSPANSASYNAWLKAHPFTPASTAAWDKAHPFANKNTPMSAAQYAAWIRAHPFTSGGKKKPVAKAKQVAHKVSCQIKTRHAATASKHTKKRTGKRIVIMFPAPPPGPKPVKPVRAARASRATRASRAVKARRGLCLFFLIA